MENRCLEGEENGAFASIIEPLALEQWSKSPDLFSNSPKTSFREGDRSDSATTPTEIAERRNVVVPEMLEFKVASRSIEGSRSRGNLERIGGRTSTLEVKKHFCKIHNASGTATFCSTCFEESYWNPGEKHAPKLSARSRFQDG
ncbi:hypothetical protein K0M31_011623 [Melipona bicolor]|uniref:Uncharacterized protein n=1 Tax=Melipona bicolor TaxID=60889 RepID=A0AA40KUU3_9HYME|nr:hypothetical protein K0M31_011623 [Melipona bicolor]